VEWINAYRPTADPRVDVDFDANSSHVLWAADIWYAIKKHWVLELQRVIRSERNQRELASKPKS
jgi:hypothetical protein